MKFLAAFRLFGHVVFVLLVGILKLFLLPFYVFKPKAASRFFMNCIWGLAADSADASTRPVKTSLITEHAHGIVLDLGAGFGHTANYIDPKRVTMYIAVEPNTRMHPRTRAAAEHAGFTEAAGSLRILACGAEDTEAILAAAGGARVDTIVAVLVLCTVPAPQDTLRALVRDVLAPGGVFLFYEHVRSDVPAVSAFQGFLSPLWRSSTDGCNINRPTHKWVEELGEEGMWREGEVKKIGDGSGGGLFPPRWGMFVKA